MGRHKPRLTLAEARMFCEVDNYIRRYGYGSVGLEQAFSDVHDGGLFRKEVDGLIRKRLLTVIPITEPPGPREWDNGLMGYCFTVDMTERAMRVFWLKLHRLRGIANAKPQSRGGLARAAMLSPTRRSEIARNAARARWQRQAP